MNENNLPKAIISDLDGTIALLNGRDPYTPKSIMDDKVNESVAHILRTYSSFTDIEIFIVSGRYQRYEEETKKWLAIHNLDFYKEIYMRPDNDKRKDFKLKKEYYEKYFKDKYDILFVLDDRNQTVNIWRQLGLTCLQVAEGDF